MTLSRVALQSPEKRDAPNNVFTCFFSGLALASGYSGLLSDSASHVISMQIQMFKHTDVALPLSSAVS